MIHAFIEMQLHWNKLFHKLEQLIWRYEKVQSLYETRLGMCTYFALHFKNEIPKYLFLKNFGHQSDDKF